MSDSFFHLFLDQATLHAARRERRARLVGVCRPLVHLASLGQHDTVDRGQWARIAQLALDADEALRRLVKTKEGTKEKPFKTE